MKRVLGVLLLLAAMYGLSFQLNAVHWGNQKEVLTQQAFFAVLTLGVGLVIITGGIDLSIGSVVGLGGVAFGVLIKSGVHPLASLAVVMGGGVVIGLIHGLLITRLKLQSFLVTLCGLFIYRGLARLLSPERSVNLEAVVEAQPDFRSALDGLRQALTGRNLAGILDFPMQLVVVGVLALVIAVLLHASVLGRYWYAMGRNDLAARYAGINTDRQRILVYMTCSMFAALGGVLTFLYNGIADPPTTGATYELYAITGAVLGGCSLRGGEGTVLGILLGAAVLPLLENLISFFGGMSGVPAFLQKSVDAL